MACHLIYLVFSVASLSEQTALCSQRCKRMRFLLCLAFFYISITVRYESFVGCLFVLTKLLLELVFYSIKDNNTATTKSFCSTIYTACYNENTSSKVKIFKTPSACICLVNTTAIQLFNPFILSRFRKL